MPLQVKSGKCFKQGDFGNRRGNPFYNCQISFNGLKIKGRLNDIVKGRILEGVSITKKADGWWASVKQEVPIRQLTNIIPGSIIGLDVGLIDMAAMSPPKDIKLPEPIQEMFNIASNRPGGDLTFCGSGMLVSNARGKEYAKQIAELQAAGKSVGKLQLKAKRHNRHTIYNDIIKPLAQVETIKIEQLSSKIGQMGSDMTSSMRLIGSMLFERYGMRVREVKPHYTSQDCSQCGKRDEKTWSYKNGRVCKCAHCPYKEHRDINAARSVAGKEMIPLEI